MIFISRDKEDNNPSYNEVIDWLLHKGEEIDFLAGQDFFENGNDWSIFLNNGEDKVSFGVPLKSSVWFRGFLNHRNHFHNAFKDLNSSNDNLNELRRRVGQETSKVTGQIYSQFDKNYQLPKFSSLKIDKFSILKKAKSIGLNVPNSLITNSKKELKKFINDYVDAISKPLHESIFFKNDDSVVFFDTKMVTPDILDTLEGNNFFPSFFQTYVEKDIELRIFYIEGDFFSMAIFSQLDAKTKLDFRNYNNENPNRNVPYLLPKSIEQKLHQLMVELDLNTGSIDMIKTPEKEYIFLEVNPTGQFGFTSKPCNYYLEEKMADTLIKNKK